MDIDESHPLLSVEQVTPHKMLVTSKGGVRMTCLKVNRGVTIMEDHSTGFDDQIEEDYSCPKVSYTINIPSGHNPRAIYLGWALPNFKLVPELMGEDGPDVMEECIFVQYLRERPVSAGSDGCDGNSCDGDVWEDGECHKTQYLVKLSKLTVEQATDHARLEDCTHWLICLHASIYPSIY